MIMKRIACILVAGLVSATAAGCGGDAMDSKPTTKIQEPAMSTPAMGGEMMDDKMSGDKMAPAMTPKMDEKMDPKMDAAAEKK